NSGLETPQQETAKLSGTANGDGSSTVAPIMDALVELYAGEQPDVKVSSGVSGTGGGFEKFSAENQDKLTAVTVDGVAPNNETIESGEYTPLSRPLFVYAKNSALKENPAFYDFMKFTLENSGDMAEAVGY
ncbi:hypothetical protein RhiirA1_405873, partial [Rhizophagus irregularis]